MGQIGIRALKQNASAVVAEAASGTTMTITDRGRPVAQVTPLPTSRLQGMLASGQARRARRKMPELPAPAAGPSLTAVLSAMRAEERF